MVANDSGTLSSVSASKEPAALARRPREGGGESRSVRGPWVQASGRALDYTQNK